MRTLNLLLALGLLASAASGGELSWPDLVRRPELWPSQCAVKHALQFQKGGGIAAGQTVNVLEIHPNEIVIGTTDGKASIGLKPDDTDTLAVARSAWAKLTPAQQELTVAAILKRPELWPLRLTLNATFDLGHGKRVKKGDTIYLMTVEKGQLVVCPSSVDLHFEVQPEDTDLYLQARKYLGDPKGAPGRLAEELQGKMINAATGAPAPFNTNALPRYYVIYHAARWCPYTQKFTPDLLKLYQEMKPKHPEFEVIYIPAEKSAAELQLYAKEMDFPWPAVDFQQKQKLVVLAWVLGRSSTPELGVLDRYGNTVIDSAQIDRDTALKQLAALWKQPPEQK
jgi:thiol-disulfide isomerase/thioredoxin